MSCPRDSRAKSGDAQEDVFGRGCPDEGRGVFVVCGKVVGDGLLQVANASERAAANRLGGDFGEEAFDEIEPRGPRGGEVNVPMGMAGEPASNFRRLVGGVVVHDEVEFHVGRDEPFDALEKLEELLVTMAPMAGADHLPCGHVQGREERRSAVAHVVVRAGLGVIHVHGQQRLRAVEGLSLGFLIDAQDHRMVGWIEVQTDDVADLLHEEGVGGELEGRLAVRLEAEGAPDAMDRRLRDSHVRGQGARAPVARSLGRGLQGGCHHLFDLLIQDRAGHARPRFIEQPIEPVHAEALAPLADGVQMDVQVRGDLRVAPPVRTSKDDLRAQGDPLRDGVPSCQRRELPALLVG